MGRTEQSVYADDIIPGTSYDLGSHQVSADEIVGFATDWDPQLFHVDGDAAARGVFGGLIASGVHTLAVLQRLSVPTVYDRWATIAARGMREVRFRKPVRPGVRLTGRLVVEEVSPRDRHRALVTVGGRLDDESGEAVLDVLLDVYVARKAT